MALVIDLDSSTSYKVVRKVTQSGKYYLRFHSVVTSSPQFNLLYQKLDET